jgi:hypothetical protein
LEFVHRFIEIVHSFHLRILSVDLRHCFITQNHVPIVLNERLISMNMAHLLKFFREPPVEVYFGFQLPKRLPTLSDRLESHCYHLCLIMCYRSDEVAFIMPDSKLDKLLPAIRLPQFGDDDESRRTFVAALLNDGGAQGDDNEPLVDDALVATVDGRSPPSSFSVEKQILENRLFHVRRDFDCERFSPIPPQLSSSSSRA